MPLSSDLISEFVKVTTDEVEVKRETTVYGTIVVYDNSKYVRLDGSDLLTPVSSTTDAEDGERVMVMIKNHTATVTGNITSPSARTDSVKEIGYTVTEFQELHAKNIEAINAEFVNLKTENATITGELTAQKATIEALEAEDAKITGSLEAVNAEIGKLDATYATIDNLNATIAKVGELEASHIEVRDLTADYGDFKQLTADNIEAINAEIDNLDVKYINAETANAKYATIENLNAANAKIDKLDVDKLDVETAEAKYATIENLKATNAEIDNLDAKYANVDFTNIGKAAIEEFFAKSGLIEDVVVGDGTVTGQLVGVTIKGDLIEGNTVVADKLVIKGEDGLYYKLNTDGVKTETEQTDYNSLNGSIITAKSITATKIDVKDLVAFDATIGGFKITSDSIYSGVKESVNNTTRGIYMDNDGQIAFGDANNFIKFYKDTDGTYKLAISASVMTFGGSNTNVEDVIEHLKDEVTTNLRIDSSRGTVFKNNSVSTVLSVVIYRGSQRITDINALHSAMGTGAYLQWKWQRLDEDTFGVISASDSRIGNNGFTLTLTPADVDTKVTFMCELIA